MKIAWLFLLIGSFMVIVLPSCMTHCTNARNIYQPSFTEEEIKWIKFQDSLPLFKYTSSDGKIDTLQGVYSDYKLKKDTTLSGGECYLVIYYMSNCDFKLQNVHPDFFQTSFEMTNQNDSLQISDGLIKLKINNTIIDTAFVNGKLYHNVLKFRYGNKHIYYIANGIGIIYSKQEDSITNLKIKETIELISK